MLVKARRTTKVYSYPRFDENYVERTLEPGNEVKVNGVEKYGVNTFYSIYGGSFVNAKDVIVVRDLDFFYQNYGSKYLTKKNRSMEEEGASFTVGNFDEMTSMYEPLQLFGLFDDVGGSLFGSLTVGGGFGGGLKPASTGHSIGDVLRSTAFGIASNLLNSAMSWLGNAINGLLGSLGSLFPSLFNYVLGFSFGSSLASLDFGNIWAQISKQLTNMNLDVLRNGLTGTKNRWATIIERYEPRKIKGIGQYKSQLFDYFSFAEPFNNNGQQVISNVTYLKWGGPLESLHGGMAPMPKVPAREAEFFDTIDKREMDEFKDALKTIREEFNIKIDRLTTFTHFNRFRVPTPDNALNGTIGYVFFTKPDLNIALDDQFGGKRPGPLSDLGPMMSWLSTSHSVMVAELTQDSNSDHFFMTKMSSCCTGIDVADEMLETTEHGETFTGLKVVYGTTILKSKTAGTVSVAFEDDNMLSIYKMIKLWTEYISAVYRGLARPKVTYLTRHILDYAVSIYYFLCANDGETILFFSKYTGCFPTATPSSTFADRVDTRIKKPNYSVQFAYSRKDDCNPMHLFEFDKLSGGSKEHNPIYNPDTLRAARSFVGPPYIHTTDGNYIYKLRFRPKELNQAE